MFAGQSAGVLSNGLRIRIPDMFSLLQGSIADEECTCMLTADCGLGQNTTIHGVTGYPWYDRM
jgi:hypothetical protein